MKKCFKNFFSAIIIFPKALCYIDSNKKDKWAK